MFLYRQSCIVFYWVGVHAFVLRVGCLVIVGSKLRGQTDDTGFTRSRKLIQFTLQLPGSTREVKRVAGPVQIENQRCVPAQLEVKSLLELNEKDPYDYVVSTTIYTVMPILTCTLLPILRPSLSTIYFCLAGMMDIAAPLPLLV